MIISHTSSISFKNFYFLFIITSLVLLLTTFLVPQKASAQFVPVRDAHLIAAFNAFLASVGGGTYIGIDPDTGLPDPLNPVEIAAEVCKTRTQPVVSQKEAMFKTEDLNSDGDTADDMERGIYKEHWELRDKDRAGNSLTEPEWMLYPVVYTDEIHFSRDSTWRTDFGAEWDLERVGPADPGTLEERDPITGAITQEGYYTNPANPYYFLPSATTELSPAEINDSTSLNCLLQELVEWEKLQINMQMHGMVKEYFTDAQTYMLSQQLLGTLAAATIEWSNKELMHTFYIDGVATTTKGPIYGDVDNVAMRMANSELSGGLDEIKGGLVAKNDLGLNPATQADMAKRINDHLRDRDSFSATKERVEYTALPAGSSPAEAYAHKARNSALNLTAIIESDISQRMNQAADKQKSQWETYGGFLSDLDCGADPFCRNPTIKTPGSILGKNLSDAIGVGTNALGTADELGETTGTSSQELTYQLQQRGLRDYQVQQLLSNQQTPQELFDEFEQVLIGYYGLGTSTTYWSRNMLVNTWDDLMWGGGAPWKAGELGKRLDEIKATIDTP